MGLAGLTVMCVLMHRGWKVRSSPDLIVHIVNSEEVRVCWRSYSGSELGVQCCLLTPLSISRAPLMQLLPLRAAAAEPDQPWAACPEASKMHAC